MRDLIFGQWYPRMPSYLLRKVGYSAIWGIPDEVRTMSGLRLRTCKCCADSPPRLNTESPDGKVRRPYICDLTGLHGSAFPVKVHQVRMTGQSGWTKLSHRSTSGCGHRSPQCRLLNGCCVTGCRNLGCGSGSGCRNLRCGSGSGNWCRSSLNPLLSSAGDQQTANRSQEAENAAGTAHGAIIEFVGGGTRWAALS